MTDLIDFVRLLIALVSFFTALVGLSEALKQRSKQRKRGRRREGVDPLIHATALPSQLQLGLPSTLFYPRMTFWTIGNAASKARHNWHNLGGR